MRPLEQPSILGVMNVRAFSSALFAAALLATPGFAAAQEEGQDGPVQCIDGGDGYLRLSLSGAANTRVFWENTGTECGGTAHENDIEFYFDRKIVEGMGGSGLTVTLQVFDITTGKKGNNLRVLLKLESNAFATGIYRTKQGNCSITVRKNELLGSMGIAQLWHIEGSGLCTGPATAPGAPPVNLSDFQFSGTYAALSLGGV